MHRDEEPELWEHQGHRLTVGGLKAAIDTIDEALEVIVYVLGAQGTTVHLPVELSQVRHNGGEESLVVAVIELMREVDVLGGKE